jgi:hypothetical protein
VVVEKASQNKRLKADWISMGPATDGVPEGSLEVEGVCEGTNDKAELMKADNLPMGYVKVQTMAPIKGMSTEAQSPSMVHLQPKRRLGINR